MHVCTWFIMWVPIRGIKSLYTRLRYTTATAAVAAHTPIPVSGWMVDGDDDDGGGDSNGGDDDDGDDDNDDE